MVPAEGWGGDGSLLDVYPQVDLVFAQNDRMAIGAYEKARQKKRAGQIAFVGVDAVTDGVESVAGGEAGCYFYLSYRRR